VPHRRRGATQDDAEHDRDARGGWRGQAISLDDRGRAEPAGDDDAIEGRDGDDDTVDH
jgi:hypothetical protein